MPNTVLSTPLVGQAMLNVARRGAAAPGQTRAVLEAAQISAIGRSAAA